MVKWKDVLSQPAAVKGGGPQGGPAGILEYISQTNGNLDFTDEDSGYKFVDDASMIEILHLLTIGMSSFYVKSQVPSDISVEKQFVHNSNLKTQKHMHSISEWTNCQEMKQHRKDKIHDNTFL